MAATAPTFTMFHDDLLPVSAEPSRRFDLARGWAAVMSAVVEEATGSTVVVLLLLLVELGVEVDEELVPVVPAVSWVAVLCGRRCC